MNDRCGWMREGGDMQCVLQSGHPEKLHVWGDLPAWAFVDEEDGSDYEEGLQEMPQMPSDSRCEVQGEEVESAESPESSKHLIMQSTNQPAPVVTGEK